MSALDARIFFAVYAARGGALTSLAVFLSTIGSGWVVFGVVPLLAVERWRRFVLGLLTAIVVSTSVVFLVKRTVDRHRPCVALDGVHALCAIPIDPSFPSGHACGSFTVAAFLVVAMVVGEPFHGSRAGRVALALVFVGLAFAVAWSRVYLGVHFPSDVAAGALLGTTSGAGFGRLFLASSERELT